MAETTPETAAEAETLTETETATMSEPASLLEDDDDNSKATETMEPEVSIVHGNLVEGEVEGLGTVKYMPVLIQVSTPQGKKRCPSDVVCVIDISGSMSTEAKIKSADGSESGHGLTLLDIARHGVKTVVKTLNKDDRLSVVMFNHQAETVFGLTTMDEAGQEMAAQKLDTLTECGGTNIWQGLHTAMENLREGSATAGGRIGHVMLLTDGQTTDRDNVMPRLQEYREKHEQLPGTLSTFGFGYNIDSDLLCQIASFGDATYSFIPDAGFVGTVFINTLSNLLVTFGREVVVAVEAEDCNVLGALARPRTQLTGDTFRVSLGTLQYEQSRSVVLAVEAKGATPPTVIAQLNYMTGGNETKQSNSVEQSIDGAPSEAPEPERLRGLYVETVHSCMESAKTRSDAGLEKAVERMQSFATAIEGSTAAERPEIKALLEDVKGQSSEAFSRSDWYNKWGVHYMPSIMFAHRVQQCNNFKDPSVQHFGGKLFKQIQDEADDIFDKLPAPQPRRGARGVGYSRPSTGSGSGGYASAAAPAAPVSMAAYNDRYGVCIDAASLAKLAGACGGARAVGELRKGDRLAAPGGGSAEVVCVVRTACEGRRATLVEMPCGARVTPFHPVFVSGEWRFPADLAPAKEYECDAVCSLVLEGAPATVLVGRAADGSSDSPATAATEEDGVTAIALAHGVQDGAARHEYFGSPAVLEDLKGAPGFSEGRVEVRRGNVLRDPSSGLVCGFRFS